MHNISIVVFVLHVFLALFCLRVFAHMQHVCLIHMYIHTFRCVARLHVFAFVDCPLFLCAFAHVQQMHDLIHM